ncbi:MAG: hypothetical protein SPL62_05870 [Selenomonas sp.]|uniref:hypothetical protein n=1 Tax=uncultured Selenomonas sp. TaxID=159275 RepID=UPI0025CF26BE|nr:hypothetical protein [uncultured Selenomonas sp.]MDD6127219.1 hypothetical protein [Veillonellaceae bacterium]MDY6350003.1 hypothetical protein [Selenomonas sp.]
MFSKLWRNLAIAFVILASLIVVLPEQRAEAAATFFTVCGDAADGSKETAVRDAQKKAVAKALAHLVTQDNPSYTKLLAAYRSYAEEPQVFQKKTQNGHLLLFSKVPVNVDAIQKVLSSANSAKQDTHDQTAYFLVRVTGLPANGDDAAAQSQVIRTYNDTFSRLGFEVGTEDAIFNALAAYRSVPYDSYEQQLKQKIETDSDYVSVTMAVIGEIAVSGAPQDGVFHRRATVQVKAYDVLSQKVIATYEDAFEFQHKDPKAADKMLLDKAAVTSARAIADQTATYWQKR